MTVDFSRGSGTNGMIVLNVPLFHAEKEKQSVKNCLLGVFSEELTFVWKEHRHEALWWEVPFF